MVLIGNDLVYHWLTAVSRKGNRFPVLATWSWTKSF